jgi:hypothetical protein
METGNQNNDKPNYAIAELTMKDGSNTIECGLFMGLQAKDEAGKIVSLKDGNKKAESFYLWLHMEEDEKTRVYSMDHFNILSLETYNGVSRTVIYFMDTNYDQSEALKIAAGIIKDMSYMATKDPDIINVKKFTDVPVNYKSAREGVSSGAPSPGFYSQYNKTHAGSRNTAGFRGTGSSTTIKKDPEPTLFKRTARRPSKKSLEKLRAKLDLIAKRDYDQKLPRIKGDKVTEEDKETGRKSTQITHHSTLADDWY